MKKQIYLWALNEGWKAFEFNSEEFLQALKERNITIGNSATIGNYATIGNSATIGYSATIGDYATIGYSATIGDYAKIGYSATIGDYAKIGCSATIGNSAKIGCSATIGDYAKIGNSEIILKTIFITGSKHTLSFWGKNIINIGCHKNSIDDWIKFYELGSEIGIKEGYSKEQIEEYYQYVLICKQLQNNIDKNL